MKESSLNFVCVCVCVCYGNTNLQFYVLYYCHHVSTQLQMTYISYIISYIIIQETTELTASTVS